MGAARSASLLCNPVDGVALGDVGEPPVVRHPLGSQTSPL